MNEERTGKYCEKKNISVVICDTHIFHSGQPNQGSDRKTVEVMIST
jgi:hypothetical protein